MRQVSTDQSVFHNMIIQNPASGLRQSLAFGEISFAPSQMIFETFLLCNVHYRPNEFDFARLEFGRASHDMDMPHFPIRHQQPMLEIKSISSRVAQSKCLLHESDVFWINPLEYQFQCGFLLRVVFEDAIRFPSTR